MSGRAAGSRATGAGSASPSPKRTPSPARSSTSPQRLPLSPDATAAHVFEEETSRLFEKYGALEDRAHALETFLQQAVNQTDGDDRAAPRVLQHTIARLRERFGLVQKTIDAMEQRDRAGESAQQAPNLGIPSAAAPSHLPPLLAVYQHSPFSAQRDRAYMQQRHGAKPETASKHEREIDSDLDVLLLRPTWAASASSPARRPPRSRAESAQSAASLLDMYASSDARSLSIPRAPTGPTGEPVAAAEELTMTYYFEHAPSEVGLGAIGGEARTPGRSATAHVQTTAQASGLTTQTQTQTQSTADTAAQTTMQTASRTLQTEPTGTSAAVQTTAAQTSAAQTTTATTTTAITTTATTTTEESRKDPILEYLERRLALAKGLLAQLPDYSSDAAAAT